MLWWQSEVGAGLAQFDCPTGGTFPVAPAKFFFCRWSCPSSALHQAGAAPIVHRQLWGLLNNKSQPRCMVDTHPLFSCIDNSAFSKAVHVFPLPVRSPRAVEAAGRKLVVVHNFLGSVVAPPPNKSDRRSRFEHDTLEVETKSRCLTVHDW